MNLYEIWAEGYAATGQSGSAQLIGHSSGDSFREACDRFFRFDGLYDSKRLTYWGCRLFESEAQARRNFG